MKMGKSKPAVNGLPPKSKNSQARIQQMGGKGNLTQKNKTR